MDLLGRFRKECPIFSFVWLSYDLDSSVESYMVVFCLLLHVLLIFFFFFFLRYLSVCLSSQFKS